MTVSQEQDPPVEESETMMSQDVLKALDSHQEVVAQVKQTLVGSITACAELLVGALVAGQKILIMGNGGSAADAQHMAAELVGRFLLERKALPAIALTTNTSNLTAIGNDYGYDDIFKRQVEALTQPGDVLIGISTSGNSRNVLSAMKLGSQLGAKTIGLLGRDGGEIGRCVDLNLTVPSQETPRIQEAHLVIIHILCDLIEKELFSSER